MNPIRKYWIDKTNESIPGPENDIAHNQGITRSYASWFTQHQGFCKWAGMAVFASYNVGRFIRFLHVVEDKLLKREVAFLQKQIEFMRETNNSVFGDIGWVHFAYLSPEGGIKAVRESLFDLPSSALILQSFEEIDEGRRLLAEGKSQGESLIWKGNNSLLFFEQERTVQPRFAEFSAWFSLFMSVTAASDFSFSLRDFNPRSFSAFYPYMLMYHYLPHREPRPPVPFRLLPNITIFEQRWTWIENRIIPIWMRANNDPAMLRFMERIASGSV